MNNLKSLLSAMLFFAIATMFLVSCEDDSLLPPTNYCGNGIMDYGETGIDCGGNCAPCTGSGTVSCFDGIQNGDETGVDCGGSCTPCTITTPTCTDGIMNGDETGVDCGGSCPDACPTATCTDGIMNGDETGVDCGGSCPDACPTCTDGIMNGDETGVDCGGSCPDACTTAATCTDGIMNGDETGVDCGGSCPACPPAGEYITAEIDGVAFAANLVLGELIDAGAVISFQSDQSQDRQMFFKVPSDITPGTYDLTTLGYSVEYAVINEGIYTTESGTITISSHDTGNQELYGTFEYTTNLMSFGSIVSTAVVNNGAFGVEY